MSEKEVVTIKELAKIQADMELLQRDMAGALENAQSSPEYKAVEVAESAYREQEDFREYQEYFEKMARLSEEFNSKVRDYKAFQLARWRGSGEKQYAGGNIQVRTKLVYDEAQLIDYLVNRKLGGFLLVNDKAIKELSPGALEYLEMTGFVHYEDNPIATIDGDLSPFLEDGND